MTDSSTSDACEAALEYLKLGYSVIPLRPRGKTPLIPWTEFKNRRASPEEIRGWFTRWPDANLGIVTGRISGLVVVDIDSPAAERALQERCGELPPTPTSLTSKGKHLVFTYPGPGVLTRGSVLEKLDVRSDGGYIVAPPSVHESGHRYAWSAAPGCGRDDPLAAVSPALRALISSRSDPDRTGQVADRPELAPTPRELPRLEIRERTGETWALSGVREGDRNNTLARYVGHLFGKGHSEEEVEMIALAVNHAEFQPPLDDDEVRSVVRSIGKRESLQRDGNPERLSASGDCSGIVLLDDVEEEELSWLWEGSIPFAKVTIVDGDPGLGKSLVTLDLAARVTTGSPMPDGTPGTPRGVVIVPYEDGVADTLKPRLRTLNADLKRVAVITEVHSKEGSRPFALPQDEKWLVDAAERVDAALIVIDPLVQALSSKLNANNDQDVRRALAALKRVAEHTGAAVVVIRHLNKKTDLSALYRGSGSIGIIGAARAGFLVVKDPDDEDRRLLVAQKSNLGRLPVTWAFCLEDSESGCPRVTWEGVSAIEVGNLFEKDSRPPDKLEAAQAVILGALRDGPLPTTQVKKLAKAAHVKDRTFERAAQALVAERRIKRYRQGGGTGGCWMMQFVSPQEAGGGNL